VDEFALIREVVRNLGDRAQGRWVELGPGDDAAIIAQSPGHQSVASIDTLVADVHFPSSAPAQHIGYRALMVALSDLAAMAATPRYVLVALTLPEADAGWVGELATGMAAAATACDTYLCGGNFAKGPLSISVSVHGEVPAGMAITRTGAKLDDSIFVSGSLGGAAACVRLAEFDFAAELNVRQQKYLRPTARFDLIDTLRGKAHSAIDVSDGLLADLQHLCEASQVQANLSSTDLPVCPGATLQDALCGGDDYEILCTANQALPGMHCIGTIQTGRGVLVDGEQAQLDGYNHFGA
jgi:thiamine-monophosphate kinase